MEGNVSGSYKTILNCEYLTDPKTHLVELNGMSYKSLKPLVDITTMTRHTHTCTHTHTHTHIHTYKHTSTPIFVPSPPPPPKKTRKKGGCEDLKRISQQQEQQSTDVVSFVYLACGQYVWNIFLRILSQFGNCIIITFSVFALMKGKCDILLFATLGLSYLTHFCLGNVLFHPVYATEIHTLRFEVSNLRRLESTDYE